MFFNPLAFVFTLLFLFLIVFFFVIVQINVIALAFNAIGIPTHYIFLALFATLLGSFINIPVKRIAQQTMVERRKVRFFGVRYAIPVWKKRVTVIAVNVGGAVIPVLLSAYLLFKTDLWIRSGVATAFMAFVTYRLARPIPGVGIGLPAFVPPILAALASVVLAYRFAPAVAYISGSLGTLIGADLLNLKKIKDLGAPVASIGGAGTFDGIFLNGILAVLLAAILV